MAVYKQEEFKAFLAAIEQSSVEHWQNIAEALNVDPDTITKWKETPEAQAAISKGIVNAIKQMEVAGKKDWRMWEKKLAMLGVNPPQKVEGDLRVDDRKRILEKYLGGDDAGEAEKATD